MKLFRLAGYLVLGMALSGGGVKISNPMWWMAVGATVLIEVTVRMELE